MSKAKKSRTPKKKSTSTPSLIQPLSPQQRAANTRKANKAAKTVMAIKPTPKRKPAAKAKARVSPKAKLQAKAASLLKGCTIASVTVSGGQLVVRADIPSSVTIEL